MEITVAGSLLKLTFPFSKATVEAVKTVPGATWSKDDRCWYAPVAALSALESSFGHMASFDYAALVAYDEARGRAAQQLHTMLTRSGATFSVTEDDIALVEGDCVSPLVADVVRERSAWIAPLVGTVATQKSAVPERVAVESTHNDKLLATGIANAVQADKRKREMANQRQRQRRQWGGGKVRQGELGI